ncbi:MAG: hypothetical protein QW051_04910, partial [Candidatus Aenigmatarchaeota archaeon]
KGGGFYAGDFSKSAFQSPLVGCVLPKKKPWDGFLKTGFPEFFLKTHHFLPSSTIRLQPKGDFG